MWRVETMQSTFLWSAPSPQKKIFWWPKWHLTSFEDFNIEHRLYFTSRELMRFNTNSPKFSPCLGLSYTKSGVGLLRIDFLACLIRMGWAKLVLLYRSIWGLGQRAPCAHLILGYEILSKFERWKRGGPESFTLRYTTSWRALHKKLSWRRIKPTVLSLCERL